MHPNKYLALAAAALIAVGAYYVTREKAPEKEVENAPLYPTLLDRLNDSQRIEIKGSDDAFTLERNGERWTMRERDGYEVRAEMARGALVQLAGLRIRERKTSKPENYPGLGVTDEVKPGTQTRRITVRTANDTVLADLIVGNARQARGLESPGHYVRKVGEPMAWLVEGELSVSAKRNDWMDTEVLNLPAERVRRVTIAHAGQPPVVVAKADPQQQLFALQGVPDGHEERSTAVISSIGGLLLDVRFDDVAGAAKIAGLTADTTVEVQTFDGLVVTLSRFDGQGRRYVKFDFAFDPQLVYAAPESTAQSAEKPAGENADASAASAPPTIKPADEVKAEIEALKKSTAPWVYALADYKSRIIDKKMEDLIKSKSAPPVQPEPIEEMNKELR